MAEVIRYFRPEVGQLPDTAIELRPEYLGTLADRKALIVLDNAEDAKQVAPLLDDLVPPTVGFVVTSRRLLILKNGVPIDLCTLTDVESVTMLLGIVGAGRGTDAEITAVAGLCSRLPLALRLAGDFLAGRPRWTVARYIKALQEEPLQHLDLGTEDRNVRAVLGLSVGQLVRDDPTLAERSRPCPCFPPTSMRRRRPRLGRRTKTTGSARSTNSATELVENDGNAVRYRLHDLMRPVAAAAFEFVSGHPAQDSTAERILAAERRFAEHYQDVLRGRTVYSVRVTLP